jgi:AraC-like DNA-binding protein
MQRSSFSTAQVKPAQRFAVWRESIGSIFDVRPCAATPDGAAFNARLDSCLLGRQLLLSRCETRAQIFERGELRRSRDQLDYYLVQTHLQGSQEVHQGSRGGVVEAGDLMVIDLAERHRAVTTDFVHLSLVIPRPLLAPLLLQPDSQAGRILKRDRPLTRLMVEYLRTLQSLAHGLTPQQELSCLEPTLTLLATVLNEDVGEAGAAAAAPALLTRVKREIEQCLRSNFTVLDLCRRLGISRTVLYRLFEEQGGVRAYVQERRLRRCAEALLSPLQAHRRIYEIAYEWGFSNEAHFSRAFRQRFGLSPSEARSAGLPGQVPPPEATAEPVGDRYYERWLAETLRF